MCVMRARGGGPEAFSSVPHRVLAVLGRGSAEPIGAMCGEDCGFGGLSEVGEGQRGEEEWRLLCAFHM